MGHINVKPLDKNQSITCEKDAIAQVIVNQRWSKTWDWKGVSFGRSMDMRRMIDVSIKGKDYSAFKAMQRRGYWRVELV
jgi:hypothetical protein